MHNLCSSMWIWCMLNAEYVSDCVCMQPCLPLFSFFISVRFNSSDFLFWCRCLMPNYNRGDALMTCSFLYIYANSSENMGIKMYRKSNNISESSNNIWILTCIMIIMYCMIDCCWEKEKSTNDMSLAGSSKKWWSFDISWYFRLDVHYVNMFWMLNCWINIIQSKEQ